MRRAVIVGLTAAMVVGACAARQPPRIQLADAAATASASGQSVGAAYLTLRNDGGQDDSLRSVLIEGVASVSVHDSRMTDGVMRMTPVRALALPAGATVAMAPGGLHLMLMGLKSPLLPGDRLKATLRFGSSPPMRIVIPVRSLTQIEAARGRD